MMKIAVMCDMHLSDDTKSAQYDYFYDAVDDIEKSGSGYLVVCGDISATGEETASEIFLKSTAAFEKSVILGNSDVRSSQSGPEILKGKADSGYANITPCDRKILCINTPHAVICENDKNYINILCDGDILFMHHSPETLKDESREYLDEILKNKSITVIHGHKHYFKDNKIGKSRVIALRALDPDKSIGAPPCITYLNVTESDITYEERIFSKTRESLGDFRDYLGISCFETPETFEYAIANNVKNLELRKYSKDEGLFDLTVDRVKRWRESGGRVLSIHIPNLRYDGGIDDSGWEYAKKLADAAGVDSLTIHPPRVSVSMMKDEKIFTDYLCDFISSFPQHVRVGFENMHMKPGDNCDDSRQFGCIPPETCMLADRINERFGFERCGAVLDVGHARNNPPFHSEYTLGKWYSIIGKRIVAYHIHQVKRIDGVLKNHRELDSWFGPMISYSSFFHAWINGQINHRPMFMEMRKLNQAMESFEAFERIKEF